MALNIADLFEHAADAVPDRIAVACGDRHETYRALDERSTRLAHHLAGLGVGPGDHVGLYARNSIEAVETLLAAYKLRARAVNINYRYVEGELRYILTDADLVALVYDRQFAALVSLVLPDSPGVRASVVIGAGSAGGPGSPAPGTPYEEALAGASPGRDFGPRFGDDIYLLYTGGTTGYPKGVLWRQEDVWRTLGGGIDFLTSEPLADEWVQSRSTANGPGLVKLCAAPLIHGSAQWTALMSFFTGDTVVLLPQFDPDEAWRAVGRHKVNVLVVVGDAMARPLIDAFAAGGYDASSVLSLSSNGALFSQSVKDAAFAALPNVVITDAIGSSETGFTGLGFASAGGQQRGGPTVRPGPATIVIGDDGRRVGPGEIGRLARGGHVPLGYYKDPVKTAAMFAEVDGRRYVVPGDWARVEPDGAITLLGRGNVSINTGGEKVFPEEVEGAIKEHPDVFDTLVIGIPDERLGQRVAAIVQPRDGASLDPADLEAVVRRHVAGYKVPRTVWLTDGIGRTPSGKADYAWARRFADAALARGDDPPDPPAVLARGDDPPDPAVLATDAGS
ncbi:MAG: acyl-CoA synthetase [Streptosporangiaceae bacterium]